MKAMLDKDGLDRRPHNIAPDCWYYEEPGGLHIYFDSNKGVNLVGIIPWHSIRASLKRYDVAKSRKARQ